MAGSIGTHLYSEAIELEGQARYSPGFVLGEITG
jgi:hypothetical protein